MSKLFSALMYPVSNFSSATSFAHYSIRRKYSGTALGIVWSVILPLCNALVLSFIFYYGFKFAGLKLSDEYLWKVLSGYFIWLAISNTLLVAATTVASNSGLLKQISFNRNLLPVSIAFEALALNALPLIIFPFFTHQSLVGLATSISLVLCTLMFILVMLVGLTSAFIIIGKKIRDLQMILTPLVSIGVYLLPIYIPNWKDIPPLATIININPFSPFIFLAQSAVLNDTSTFYSALPAAILISVSSWLVGVSLYQYYSTDLGDGI